MLLAIFDRVFITNRTARLNKGSDTGCMTQLHAIIEREEGITGKYGFFQIEFKLTGFFQSMTQGINTAGLSAAFTDQLFIFNQCNGI